MSRVLLLISILVIMVALVVGPTTAQTVTPTASPVANRPLDLAAIVLYPHNLDALGLPGFGIVRSSLRDLETQAALDVLTRMVTSSPRAAGTPAAATVQDRDPDLEERLAFYRDAGFRHRYTLTLLRPRIPVVETTPGTFTGDVGVVTSVTEFDSAEKAASAFLVIEDERGNPNARDVPGTHLFGDQSEVTHSSLLALDQGVPYLELNLTFQVGALIADVSVADFTGAEPKLATVEALAEALQAKVTRAQAAQQTEPQRQINVARGLGKQEVQWDKIERARGTMEAPGPGLSWRVLRLTPDPQRIFREVGYDGYVRLDRQRVPEFAALAEARRTAQAQAGAPAVTPETKTAPPDPATAPDPDTMPIYTYHYWTPLGEGDPAALPSYRVQLTRYPSAEAARLANVREGLRQPLEPGGGTIERTVDDAVVFGDEGFAVWYGYGEGGVVATRQYIIYARVAAQFVSVEVNDLPADAEAPAAAMATLMAAQVACLEAARWCEPVPVPAALQSAAAVGQDAVVIEP